MFADRLPYLQYFSYLSQLPAEDVGAGGQWYTVQAAEHIQIWSLNR